MKLPARAALALSVGAALLTAGCRNYPPEYTEDDSAVPQGVSLEPPAEAPSTGGVAVPGTTAPDEAAPGAGTAAPAGAPVQGTPAPGDTARPN